MCFEQARRLVAESLVWDNHSCMPLRPLDKSFLPQLSRHLQAGFDVISLNVGFDALPWYTTLPMIASFRTWIRDHPESLLQIESVDDIECARSTGRLGVFFNIEGGSALNGNHELVESYYELGVRWMLIAYDRNNALGGGCREDNDPGLTPFGRSVLDEMERAGMIACCSHTGHRTAWQVLEHASNPIIFSHSNANAVWNSRRNIPDELIVACAETGGVVGVNGIGAFLGRDDAGPAAVVRHIDHMVQRVGSEHVGIGLDFVFDQHEGASLFAANPEFFHGRQPDWSDPLELVQPEQLTEIVAGLCGLGYGDDAVRDILGGNFLRVARGVWK